MKYLKKFNESTSGEMDFETFKEIMFDLSDFFECDFKDHSEDVHAISPGIRDPDYNGFYDCWINIPFLEEYSINDDAPFFNFDYLDYTNDVIPPFEELDNINTIFENDKVYDAIQTQEDKLYKLKNDLDRIIENNAKIKNVFKIIQEHILPRFDQFSNFLQSDIGFDNTNCILRVTFEIKATHS